MTIWINKEECDGCKRCQRVCPYEGIEVTDGVAMVTDRCTSCGACVDVCKKEGVDFFAWSDFNYNALQRSRLDKINRNHVALI